LGTADETKIFNKTCYVEGKDYVNLREVTSLYDKIPLIKINQSCGNSFQIHIKKSDGRWLPKMESSYFLEDGVITFGIKKGISVDDYKNACLKIDKKIEGIKCKNKKRKYIGCRSKKGGKKFYC
jgi:hypothetical protein